MIHLVWGKCLRKKWREKYGSLLLSWSAKKGFKFVYHNLDLFSPNSVFTSHNFDKFFLWILSLYHTFLSFFFSLRILFIAHNFDLFFGIPKCKKFFLSFYLLRKMELWVYCISCNCKFQRELRRKKNMNSEAEKSYF